VLMLASAVIGIVVFSINNMRREHMKK
jgi:hypothetical protein